MTEGPTAPTAAAADVVSLYSDTYTEEAGNFRTDWSLGSDYSVVDLAGNSVLKYENMSMAGMSRLRSWMRRVWVRST